MYHRGRGLHRVLTLSQNISQCQPSEDKITFTIISLQHIDLTLGTEYDHCLIMLLCVKTVLSQSYAGTIMADN